MGELCPYFVFSSYVTKCDLYYFFLIHWNKMDIHYLYSNTCTFYCYLKSHSPFIMLYINFFLLYLRRFHYNTTRVIIFVQILVKLQENFLQFLLYNHPFIIIYTQGQIVRTSIEGDKKLQKYHPKVLFVIC